MFAAAFGADAATQGSGAADRAALEALYDATGGANWTDDTNWKTSAPLGEWYGVTTDIDGRVKELRLDDNGLAGSMPPALGSLTNLSALSLRSNELTGPIPGEFGSLANLLSLNLGWNRLTGPVPALLGNLTQLRFLGLNASGLTGPIPVELGRLANLEFLDLSQNELTGRIPIWLGNLAQLQGLELYGSELTDPIPVELGRLANLRTLDLSGNELTGPVPAWLGNLTQLGSLRLAGNELTGPIPVELGSLVNLWGLKLSYNNLSGRIPAGLGSAANLRTLDLSRNDLTGPVPVELGSLANLERLDLSYNDLTGSIPSELGSLADLETLDLSYTWGLSGPLPAGLELSSLAELDFFVTQTCAPKAWREWLATIEFYGPLCDAGTDATIDVAVVYTPAALEAAGGAAAIEAEIDLMIAETNEAYAASGVEQRLALVGRSEVPYTETGGFLDLGRLTDPSDGHLDEAHALRDGTGADVVHLIVGESDGGFYNVCGIANLPGAFGITLRDCGGITFAHELGHNMGLRHNRFQVQLFEGGVSSHPAYGYVNGAVFETGSPQSGRWITIMSYPAHCRLADVSCWELPRFSNPRQRYDGDPLGIAYGAGSGVTGPADAAAVLNATGPAVAAWRDRTADAANRPPAVIATLPDRRLGSVGSELDVDVSQAFMDPDGDALTYTVSSSAPWVATVAASSARVTLTAVSEGAATVRVAATDPGGLSVSGSFSVTVEGAGDTDPQGSVESDRAALEALYNAAGGASWTDSTNWKTSAPLGEWYGVTTDAAGRVTGVDLDENALAGWLPPAVGSLAHLETLRLGGNALTDPIPAALGNLSNLEWLSLWGTQLTGPIPRELGRLVNLRMLDLSSNPFSSNHLTGPIPVALGNLVNLEDLLLDWNDLTGPVPARLGNLPQLRRLSLDGNELTGRIPGTLGSLANLQWLGLSRNNLTGEIPAELGRLASLESLSLGGNELTGRIPGTLGSLASLQWLDLSRNNLTGEIPAELGSLANLERLDLSYAWGLSGPLPDGLEQSALEELDVFVTRACAPAAWQEWLATIAFLGPLCGVEPDVTIDVAVVYTPAAREAAGGSAAIEAAIDLMVAETNQAYAASGVHQRVVLMGRSEVPYMETFSDLDLFRLADPSDGHLDEAHALRDRTGADMVHLIVGDPYYDVCGIAFLPFLGWPGPFGITRLDCGGIVFAHELGHNMGLRHDRFQVQVFRESVSSHPAYGYVNQRMFGAEAPPSSRWVTVMAYDVHCGLADVRCSHLPRFSNPRHRYGGDALGVPFGVGTGVTGPADAAAVLNATGPAMAALRDRPPPPNRPPALAETLPDLALTLPGTLDVDVSAAFVDPDGDALTYAVSSSAPSVVTVSAAGARVTLTAVSGGTATIRVTATDPGGLSATQAFTVTVSTGVAGRFSDDPIRPGVTPVRAIHFTELRARIDFLREAAGLGRFRWTDPVLRVGVTRVRTVHLMELRSALAAVYAAAGRSAPRWTDPAPVAGTTSIRAVHLMELRAAVVALE